jgi:hypothetical protein
MLPGQRTEPEPEPAPLAARPKPAPRGRLPPLKAGGGGGPSGALTEVQRSNQEELGKKKLSELCKLARAKDIDQYDIDEAVEATNPKQAILALLSGNPQPTAKAGGAAAAGGGYPGERGDECVSPVPGNQKELQVLCVTWNLKGMLPEDSLTPLLPTGAIFSHFPPHTPWCFLGLPSYLSSFRWEMARQAMISTRSLHRRAALRSRSQWYGAARKRGRI